MKVRLTLTEELLGTASADPEIHKEFIASKGPDAQSLEEEVEAVGVDEVVEKAMTVFPRNKDGKPILWDYQIKGFFKDACSMMNRVAGTKSGTLTAFRKIIDGLVFVKPRAIRLELPEGGEIGNCQRPLRAQTAQGERIALANSETVPAGTQIEFEIVIFKLKGTKASPAKSGKEGAKKVPKKPTIDDCVMEWLEYGALRGLGQWRNSGKGRFEFEVIG